MTSNRFVQGYAAGMAVTCAIVILACCWPV